jgi:hypothetical protein
VQLNDRQIVVASIEECLKMFQRVGLPELEISVAGLIDLVSVRSLEEQVTLFWLLDQF